MSLLADVEGYIMLMSATIGWTRVEIQVLIAHIRHEVRSGKYHTIFKQKVVWGRRPG